jgi:hypothetical protein
MAEPSTLTSEQVGALRDKTDVASKLLDGHFVELIRADSLHTSVNPVMDQRRKTFA